jgi:hypothetical protein
MKTLCPLTDWKETLRERGRGAGTKTKTRWLLCGDIWCWAIGLEDFERQGQLIQNTTRYYKNIAHILYAAQQIIKEEVNMKKIATTIAGALYEKTGIEPDIDFALPVLEIGVEIDKTYRTSYCKEYPPTVLDRIFKEEENVELSEEDGDESDDTVS